MVVVGVEQGDNRAGIGHDHLLPSPTGGLFSSAGRDLRRPLLNRPHAPCFPAGCVTDGISATASRTSAAGLPKPFARASCFRRQYVASSMYGVIFCIWQPYIGDRLAGQAALCQFGPPRGRTQSVQDHRRLIPHGGSPDGSRVRHDSGHRWQAMSGQHPAQLLDATGRRGGGTGRRTGLKILGAQRTVRVRFPPPAPKYN